MRSSRGGCERLMGAALWSLACGANKDGLLRPAGAFFHPVRARLDSAVVLPGDELFRAGKVLEVRLSLLPELLRELEERGDREKYVSASVRLGLQGEPALELGEIGVRYEGDYSLHHCWDESGGVRSHADECAKLSIKLKFDAQDLDTILPTIASGLATLLAEGWIDEEPPAQAEAERVTRGARRCAPGSC